MSAVHVVRFSESPLCVSEMRVRSTSGNGRLSAGCSWKGSFYHADNEISRSEVHPFAEVLPARCESQQR